MIGVGAGAVGDVYRPLVLILAMCGLRIREATALDVGDVDRVRKRIRVRASKTGRARDVPLPATVETALDLDRPGDAPLLTGPEGRRVRDNSFRRRQFAWAKQEVGLPEGLRIHDLRHTVASLAIAAGADLKVVQAMLGNASATMTLDLYGHLLDRRLGEVAAAMDGLLG